MTCTHEPVIMVDRGPDGGYRAECKYCGMRALNCETQEKAMLDWVKMNRPYAGVIELLLPAAPFMAAIIIFAVWNLR